MLEVNVGGGQINLTQLMKRANLAESGGRAKAMIVEGLVRVNGAIESRRRRQLAVGDVVEVEGHEAIRVVIAGGLE